MSAFTKGPWIVYTEDESIGSITTADGVPIAQAMQVKSIKSDLTQQERRANTRLIASAPELLQIAQFALAYIDAIPKDLDLPAMPGFDRDWADSVIASADRE